MEYSASKTDSGYIFEIFRKIIHDHVFRVSVQNSVQQHIEHSVFTTSCPVWLVVTTWPLDCHYLFRLGLVCATQTKSDKMQHSYILDCWELYSGADFVHRICLVRHCPLQHVYYSDLFSVLWLNCWLGVVLMVAPGLSYLGLRNLTFRNSTSFFSLLCVVTGGSVER